jgi:C-terminal processing protease CtpA/Prc
VALLVLVSCGGGGGGGGITTPPANGLVAASGVAARCAAPRPSSAGTPFPDVQGSLLDEKTWVRSWIDETYLWYPDVRGLSTATLNPANYVDPITYFKGLKSPAITASGKPKDQFHFVYNTADWTALVSSGTSWGYGFELAALATTPPRNFIVAYTTPGTPAAAAGIARGAQILNVDGIDLVNDNTTSGVAALNAGLFPSAAGNHSFTLLDAGATVPHSMTLNASALTLPTVQNVKTMPAPNQAVGYLQFNDHLATSEAELKSAIDQLRVAGVTDLVLDLRYNGGGYLDIASELAYMIAGPAPTSSKIFEKEIFNDRNPFGLSASQATTPFYSTTQGFSLTSGSPLPTLNLSRVFVLAGAGTCSASEAIVNGLRGVGVQVNLVGATTCGKPYGFLPQDNCGTTYFAIQFKGVNQAGFGDYADGFAPTCAVADDFAHPLGDPAEARLASALSYRNTGQCMPPLARGQGLARTGIGVDAEPVLLRNPARENRIFRAP